MLQPQPGQATYNAASQEGGIMNCKFCTKCGKPLNAENTFCPSCGAAVATANEEGIPERLTSVIRPGFSDKINDPAIRAAMKKSNKVTAVFALLLVLAPLVVTLILGLKNNDFSYLRYGIILATIFMLFSLVSAAKKKGEKQWDGTVIEKHIETRQENTSADGDDGHSTYMLYIVQIRKENGRVKKLKEKEYNHHYYDYLQVGDRVRYHPQFNYYYEKYDKSLDSYAICPVCSCKNDISCDTCARCGVPVIK